MLFVSQLVLIPVAAVDADEHDAAFQVGEAGHRSASGERASGSKKFIRL